MPNHICRLAACSEGYCGEILQDRDMTSSLSLTGVIDLSVIKVAHRDGSHC